jgi:hypothetical protein
MFRVPTRQVIRSRSGSSRTASASSQELRDELSILDYPADGVGASILSRNPKCIRGPSAPLPLRALRHSGSPASHDLPVSVSVSFASVHDPPRGLSDLRFAGCTVASHAGQEATDLESKLPTLKASIDPADFLAKMRHAGPIRPPAIDERVAWAVSLQPRPGRAPGSRPGTRYDCGPPTVTPAGCDTWSFSRCTGGAGLASAIHDEANEPKIMPLSCVDACKSAHEAAPVGCGPNEALPQLRGCP